MTQFFDAHTHIQFSAYDSDRDDVLSRAGEAGVKMVAVGTDFGTSEAAIRLAEKHKGEMWATVGFHPNHLAADWYHDSKEKSDAVQEKFSIDRLRSLAENSAVVAVGECGLDYFRLKGDESEKVRQQEVLSAHIDIARTVKKPLMIHCRSAFNELIDFLRVNGGGVPPGVIHFFTGTVENAKALVELGYGFTFGGVATFARDYDEVIKLIPADRILSETDAPYVAPLPYRGQRNEPAFVVETVKKLALLRGISVDEMAEQIFINAKRIFSI